MTPDTDVKPVAASSITSWDDEADVVIAGYGVAGAAAAVEAARSGADVLVAERTGSWGGAAAMAGGFIHLGVGTGIQRACSRPTAAGSVDRRPRLIHGWSDL